MIFIKDFMQYLSFYLKDWHKYQVTGSEYALPFFIQVQINIKTIYYRFTI